MSLNDVKAGRDVPNDINVVIEIPEKSSIKYEIDKDSGALFVDRFLNTAMYYPCNYGYIPQTLADDGDAVDVLVLAPVPVTPGSVIRCRVIGMLNMKDESGEDVKILAVPHDKVCKDYSHIKSYLDVNPNLIKMIEHFFTHYKDLEVGKWVKIDQWYDADRAKEEILKSIIK
jgi:inorganic pyrophosphatase